MYYIRVRARFANCHSRARCMCTICTLADRARSIGVGDQSLTALISFPIGLICELVG